MPSTFGNYFIKAILNSPLYPLMGPDFAVITLSGRKTGQTISTPINVIRLGDTLTVISMRSRTWWRNLKNGQIAQLRHAGSRYPVRGEITDTPAEVTTGLEEYFVKYPDYAKYFKLPVGADGKPDPTDLERIAAERVLVRLFPVNQ